MSMVHRPSAFSRYFLRKQISLTALAKLKLMQCHKFSSYFNSASKFCIKGTHTCTLVYRGDEICKKDDFVDFFGIIVHGAAFISFESSNKKSLGIGNMIGQMNFADMCNKEKYAVTVLAKTDGLIAVVPYGEVKMEIRRSPI